MFSLLIKNGLVIDGTGRSPFSADVGISSDKIVALGRLDHAAAVTTIDANGMVVAPGFIDFHSHADAELLKDPTDWPKLSQGVTTEVIGNCGISLVPGNSASCALFFSYTAPVLGQIPFDFQATDVGSYLDILKHQGVAVNVVTYVGHGSIRLVVLGMVDRQADNQEMAAMSTILREAMEQGARGLSSGLLYPPGCYATTSELISLSRVSREFGGLYVTHIRNESEGVLEAISEALQIGREAGIPVHISHLKACGPRNWPKVKQALTMLDKARDEGQDVTWDVYPYIAGSTTAASLFPTWAVAGGTTALQERLHYQTVRQAIKKAWQEGVPGWDNMVSSLGFERLIINNVKNRDNEDCIGLSLAEIGAKRRCDPADALMDLFEIEGGNLAIQTNHANEQTLEMILRHPATIIGSDGIYSGSHTHPRLYGTFPRVLGRYVRDKKVLSLEEAVAKMTSLPATRLGLNLRGRIQAGYYADLVIFDPAIITDQATFQEPTRTATGIEAVIVNGRVAIWKGKFTGELAGAIITSSEPT
ncbi:N-acyl-D-amino-acid deacylase family protein [Moorella sp. E306M]|jgi:dihydroorotase/N-acyl-D-amino-acid deacylase|uniref:N-acyl-D-amino-acid deacylase family protein n=1 Tax=Moorella sp. E306M TaxID=2572683 RepID=UPI0010FFBFCA|nr:D-aminoacylase [Moorella sp. E306M]GEA17571.1 dihydroorotase [Moorella sp. E306M]